MTMHDLKRSTAVLLGAALLGVGVGAGAAPTDGGLLAGMDRMREEDANRLLHERIEVRASVGAAGAPLADWLVSEGFKIKRLPIALPPAVEYAEAFKTTGSPVCRRQALVRWRTAADGTITWLSTHYGISACL
ncbi:hypothetical protein ASD21_10230 [Caulobacter sp. Root1455]|uniref:hypothetical protein n=1 Tax=Caulobacter sp. Root1455 TaxID=1736465 RepID=UPI0006F9E64A|nr:hypothetical protein [Caulobacter sp. Root1455]KQY93951.1 hypothetical protein ASD21_10230 [Caulobacter sp. Root1455]